MHYDIINMLTTFSTIMQLINIRKESPMNLNSTARKMTSIARDILDKRGAEPSCVHKNLTLRVLVMLKKIRPDSEDIFAPIAKNARQLFKTSR